MKLRMVVVVVISTLLTMGIPGNARSQTGQICFPQTNQCIEGRIREFWEQNGGLAIFGYPIRPQMAEIVEGNSFQAQWFERERFELHPENARPYDVLLGRLGADRLSQQGMDWFQFPQSQPQAGCRFFPQTGHNVCGDFLQAWRANGLEFDGRRGKSQAENLALFGLPLSDVFTETLSDGKPHAVQWFERTRFEAHSENKPPFDILFGLLGKEILEPPPPPTANPRLAFSPADLESLTRALERYGLSTKDVNVDKTVTYALPSEKSIIVQSAPLVKPSQSKLGTVLGVLNLARPLGSASDPKLQVPAQAYVVVVQNGQLQLVPPDADPRNLSIKVDVRRRASTFPTPDALINNDLICYGPEPEKNDQVCLDLAPKTALTQAEIDSISKTMNESLDSLNAMKLLSQDEMIDVTKTTPAIEGEIAVKSAQASLLAAPATNRAPAAAAVPAGGIFVATQQITRTQPVSGTLLGMISVIKVVQLASPPTTILTGTYTVRLVDSFRPAPNQWNARLEGTNGSRVELPVTLSDVLGQAALPNIVLRSVCFDTWLGTACLF